MAVYENKIYVLIVVTSEQVAGLAYLWRNKQGNTILGGSYGYSDDIMSGVYSISILTFSSCMFGRKMI
jgi:hypothetical protein